MSRPDEVARQRARALGHPSTFERPLLPRREPPPAAVTPERLTVLRRNREEASEALVESYEELRAAHAAVDLPGGGLRVTLARERVRAAHDRMEASSLRLEAARAVMLAHRDTLTGCLSRDSGLEQLQHELDRSRRQQTDLVVAFLDVDGLKQVNDTHGHLAGDALLRAVGESLLECLRSYDVVLRFGGDEFVCGLPGLLPPEARERFDDVGRVLDRKSPGARFTVGLALAYGPDDVEALLERADADLYLRRRNRSTRSRGGLLPPRPAT